ncbi:MAG: hypothetical protein Q8S26_08865 [Azonexus sp.]|nr:hypothetical protein [Azonexus sp.]
MTTNAKISLCKEVYIAEISDGRRLEHPDFFDMAQALSGMGIRANRLHFDWRSGTRMITAGTQVALMAEMRHLENTYSQRSTVG